MGPERAGDRPLPRAADRPAVAAEPWYINLGGNPAKPTVKPKYVVMYFLGAEHLIKCFIPMWDRCSASSGPLRWRS